MSYNSKYTGAEVEALLDLASTRASQEDLNLAIERIDDLASEKQDELVSGTNIKTINGAPILGSGNIAISEVYTQVNHGTSNTTFTLTPNTFHVWDEVESLTLSFGPEQSGVANEFVFQFISGATATSLTLPDDIKWANDSAPTIAENMIYQISVLNGLAIALAFSNKIQLIDNKLTITDSGNRTTFSFQYPVESDVTIVCIPSELMMNMEINIPKGSQSVSKSFGPGNTTSFVSMSPASDSVYNYIY